MKKDIEYTIKKAQAGNRKAFEELYRMTYNKNYYIIFKILNNEQDTLDVLQETYLKIFTKLNQYVYKGQESFLAWTGRVASNTALDFLRRKKPIIFTEIEQVCEDGVLEFDIEDPSVQYRPEIVYDKKETAEIVEELLGCLSDEQRICIVLFYLQEMSIKEIAQFCNCSENTIKSRLNYGRKKICEQGETLKKRDITLMGAMPFTWLIYALKQQEVTAKTQVIAAEISRKMLKNILINLENADSTGTVTTAVSKGFAIAKMGTGKVTAIVAAGALGVGLTAGIVIGRYQGTTDSVPATEGVPTTEIETTAQVSATEKKSTTVEEITEVLTELSTEQVTTVEKASEVNTTTEKVITTTEQHTEKKTTASTELESMEWDDDYIEWDE